MSTYLAQNRTAYDDATPRKFLFATLIWGILGMLVGVVTALQLADPVFNFNLEWLLFGRLRPLHTNAVIFAVAGNGIFCGIYYSTQRLLKTRMFSDKLSNLHFWGWQLIIVAAALTLLLGATQGKEYAELEWPIDIAVVLIWVVFAINMFGTIAVRREQHIYVAIWFYIATIVAVAILYIFNNLSDGPSIHEEYESAVGLFYKEQAEKLGELDADEATIMAFTQNEGQMLGMKSVFAAKCASCHASDGSGGLGPNLCDNEYLLVTNVTDIYDVLSTGSINKGMPAWKGLMPDVQLVLMSSYVANLRGSTEEGTNPQGVTIPPWPDPPVE